MRTLLLFLTLAAMAATFIVLMGGLINLLNTSKNSAQRSNRIMQLRVFFQALALAFFALLLFFFRK